MTPRLAILLSVLVAVVLGVTLPRILPEPRVKLTIHKDGEPLRGAEISVSVLGMPKGNFRFITDASGQGEFEYERKSEAVLYSVDHLIDSEETSIARGVRTALGRDQAPFREKGYEVTIDSL